MVRIHAGEPTPVGPAGPPSRLTAAFSRRPFIPNILQVVVHPESPFRKGGRRGATRTPAFTLVATNSCSESPKADPLNAGSLCDLHPPVRQFPRCPLELPTPVRSLPVVHRVPKRSRWVAVDERFDDEGASGATLNRPALRRLLAPVREHGVDQAVVDRFDRFARRLIGYVRLLEEFRKPPTTT